MKVKYIKINYKIKTKTENIKRKTKSNIFIK